MKRFKLIFLLSLTLLMIFGTTSFANVTEEYVEYCLQYLYDNGSQKTSSLYQNALNYALNTEGVINSITNNINDSLQSNDYGSLNNVNMTAGYWPWNSSTILLCFTFSNSGAPNGNNIDFLYISKATPSAYQGDNGDLIFNVTFYARSNQVTFKSASKYSNSDIKIDYNNITFNENLSVATISDMPFCGAPAGYINHPISDNTNKIPVIFKDLNGNFGNEIDPEVSGDIGSGDTESGDITESGDTGGGSGGEGTTTPDYSEDLNEIKNELNNIKENIPTSGEIAGATTQGNKDFWGNKDEMSEEDYENQISDGINDSMDQITGELEQNEVFNSIAIAEQKIIDLFLEEPEDFKISWQDVKYLEKTLVPAGEINFSQMCRENEALGRVKNTLNIIVSAMISLSLFRYIFNLIMVTLGIDHPLILETEKDDITEISSTKIGNKTYITKKTYKSDKKKGGR